MILIEDFYSSILKFKEVYNYNPYDLEFVLFGFSYDEQSNLSEKQKDKLHDTYGNLYCDVRMKNLDVKTFIEKVKTELKDLRKVVVAERSEKDE